MMLFLLLWDPVVQILLVSPIVLYAMGIDRHPFFVAVDVILILGAIAAVLRRLFIDDKAVRGAAGPRDECRWLEGWDADMFLRHLTLFIRTRGWRVVATAIIGPDRATLVVEKEKCRLALLCLRPGTVETAADRDTLRALRQSAGASREALVGPPGTTPLLSLRYEDLRRLDDALGLNL